MRGQFFSFAGFQVFRWERLAVTGAVVRGIGRDKLCGAPVMAIDRRAPPW